MPFVVIEPGFLAIPVEPPSREELRRAAERVIELYNVLREHDWLIVCRESPEVVTDVLQQLGTYPIRDRLRDLLKEHGLHTEYSAGDICVAINGLIQEGKRVADVLPVWEADCESFASSPDLCSRYQDPELQQLLRSLLSALASSCHCDPAEVELGRLALGCIASEEAMVTVRTMVREVLPGEGKGVIRGLPRLIEENVHLWRGLEELADSFDPRHIWKAADHPKLIRLAIQLAARKMLRESGRLCSLDQVPEFRIGTGFWDSLVATQADRDRTFASDVLDACTRVVAGQAKKGAALQPFKVEAKSKSPQRLRSEDKAKAWRMHVTLRHEALRLMVWERMDGVFEFANIGNKWEERIEEGDPSFAH
jgi:hypothetical protein